jgi:hypothetical protein
MGKIREKFVLGTDFPVSLPEQYSEKCSICGKAVFFGIKWDWSKYKPICQDCVIRERSRVEIHLSREVVKSMMKHGFSGKEVRDIHDEVVKKLKKGEKIGKRICFGG